MTQAMLRVLICLTFVLSGCANGIRAISNVTKAPNSPEIEAPPPPAPVVIEQEKPVDQTKLADQVARIAEELTMLQNAVAKLIASSRQQDDQLNYFRRRLGELEPMSRTSRARGDSARDGFASSSSPVAPAPVRPVTTTRAEDLYQAGMEHFQAKELDAALLLFSDLVTTHPDHPLRESAQFLVADILYAQDDCRGALTELEALLAMAPHGSNAPDALLKIGLCQRRLGAEDHARQAWERLVKEHPKSASARQAAALLTNSRKR